MKTPGLTRGCAGKLCVAVLSIVSLCLVWTPPTHAAEPSRSNTIIISHDQGGDIVNYAQRVSRAKHSNAQVRFQGKCQSACTMFLALPAHQTCIAPGASFSFHRAYGASNEMNAWGTQYLLKSYPVWVASWIQRNGGLKRNLIHMDYAYASQHIPSCSRQAKQSQRQIASVARKNTQPTR